MQRAICCGFVGERPLQQSNSQTPLVGFVVRFVAQQITDKPTTNQTLRFFVDLGSVVQQILQMEFEHKPSILEILSVHFYNRAVIADSL